MKKVFFSFLTALLLLTGCSTMKTIKLMESGEVEQEEFNVEIPFGYRLGLIVLKVEIAGEEYDFLLDTGAPNVISKELAQKLGLINEHEQKVGDSQGRDSDLGFTTIDKLSIGGIHFTRTGTVIADLKLSKEVGCLEVDGFIGSNLMKKAIWKFDYQNQLITITNSMESFDIPESINKIPFSTELTGTPVIDIQLNDVIENNVTLDLGSNGDFSLSRKTYDSLIKNNPSIPQTYSFGSSTSGLYGRSEPDSTFYVKVPSVAIGDISLDSTIVDFTSTGSATLGTEFFKNYDLIINWFTSEVILINQNKYNYSTFSSLGFDASNQENKLVVSAIYENMEDLKLGDQILSFDGINCKELTLDQWCEIIDKRLLKDKEELSLTILRNNNELQLKLKNTKHI